MNVEQKFLTIAAKDSGLASIINFLYQLTNCDIIVCDSSFYPLVRRGSDLVKDISEDFLYTCIKKCAYDQEFYICNNTTDNELKRKYIVKIIDGQPLYGYLIVFTNDINEKTIRQYMLSAGLALQVVMKQIRFEQQIEQKYFNEFLQDILHNNIVNYDMLMQRGMVLGIDFSQPYALMLVELVSINKDKFDSLLANRWCTMMKYHISQNWPETIFSDRRNQIILLIPQKQNYLNKIELNDLFNSLQQKTQKLLQKDLVGGVGQLYETNDQLFKTYQEAKVALETGMLLKYINKINYYNEIGIIRLLVNQGEQALSEYFENTIGIIEIYDKENQTNLMQTLYVFLNYSGDKNEASNALFIHINTLRYRLKKIEEILKKDLKKYDTVVNLYLALQIGIMIKKLNFK